MPSYDSKSIDFVVPWVDGSDPSWQAEFKKYKGDETLFSDTTDKRYRDWGLFKYWFRGVEKYAPWVNKVHLITCGHYPDWLNLDHPKLNFVKHEDYIPEEFLPTFNVNPIEINLHRIKELSEKFVYFNDDLFLINDSKPSHFFKNHNPNDSAILSAYDGTGFSKIQLNNTAIINKYFTKKICLKNNMLGWFNPKYGFELVRNLLLLPWNNFTGLYDYHLTNSYLKSTFEQIWETESDLLLNVSSNKFRNLNEDVTQNLFRFWQLASGKFNPINKHSLGDYLSLGVVDTDKAIEIFRESKKPLICLNDHDPADLDKTIMELKKVFEEKFPNKSSFEL